MDLSSFKCMDGYDSKGAVTVSAGTFPEVGCFDVYRKLTATELSHSQIAKGMTSTWYGLKKDYDFTTGLAKGSKTYDDIAGFTAMIWKGGVPTTDYVGFAVTAGCAGARFCVAINKKVGTPSAIK